MFADRIDAARQLAARLQPYRGRHPLLLAIPRGAVPMARLLADALGGDFDVVLVRKLRAPRHAETAVGAVDESGWTYLAPLKATSRSSCCSPIAPTDQDGKRHVCRPP